MVGNGMAGGGMNTSETRKERMEREFESLRTRWSHAHSEISEARSLPVRVSVTRESRIERLDRDFAELSKDAGC